MNEKDWNVADDYQPHQRVYVKRDNRVRVMIDDEPLWLPEEMLEDAYLLDDERGNDGLTTLIRIPKFANNRAYIQNDDVVFFTLDSEETYKHRIEIGDLFRYKDTSSSLQDEEDEEIVPEAPEWLNNLCNRIDALEAQVEMLEPDNFRNLVMSLIESPAFAHVVYNTVRQQSIRYQNSQKTLKDLWDSNTPLYYRDKGWR